MPDPEVFAQDAAAPPGGTSSGATSAGPVPDEEGPPRATVADASADLIQMVVDYLRQETGDLMRDKVVLPGQQLGQVIAFAVGAALVLFLGIAFVATGALMLLALFVGWIAALFIVGAVLLAGAGVLSYFKVRSIQQ